MQKKILVVDDDPSLLALVKSFLTQEYEVHCFSDGEQALTKAEEIQPDLILSDVLMTQMSGYELLINLKKSDSSVRNIPVVVMSTRENLKGLFEGNPIAAFLPKPFSRAELVGAVQECLNKKPESC